MASIKNQKEYQIRAINKRIKEIEKNNEFVLTSTKNRIENFNPEKMTLKELKTFRTNLSKRNIQSQAKTLVNYELKLLTREKEKSPVLTYKQINELYKSDLLEKYKQVASENFTTKKNKKFQENLLSNKLNITNLKRGLEGESINKALTSIEKTKNESALSDFEYLKQIVNRTGIEKYKRLIEKVENGEMLLDKLKENMENNNRDDWYETVLKSQDYTDSFIDKEDFEKNNEINNEKLNALINKDFENVYSESDLKKLIEMGFINE